MLPALASHAIGSYSQPGDTVLDPMCGIGTTLVEAVHLGRDAVGIEYEPEWAELAKANLALARGIGAPGRGEVVTGDARHLGSLIDPSLRRQVALVLTSPPYGPSTHGHITAQPGRGVAKRNFAYSADPANLARAPVPKLLMAMAEILAGCRRVLRPAGRVVLTARPWRRNGVLVDLPGALRDVAERSGLVLIERNVALLARVSGDELVSRVSFFQLERIREARRRGVPLQAIAHEDVLVFGRES